MENSNSNFGKILAALFAGAAIGAAAGVLFAPEKGSKTREKIAKKAKKLSDDVKHTAEEVKSRFDSEVDNLRDKAHRFSDKAEDRVQDMAHGAKQTADAMRNGK